MNINEQLAILKCFDFGKIYDLYESSNGIMLIIKPEDEQIPYSIIRCELVNCKAFVLNLRWDFSLTDLNEIKKYEIVLRGSEIKNNKLLIDCLIDQKKKAYFSIETESIKVSDEFKNGIPLLDLSIINGLCTSGVGIDLIIANTIEEAKYSRNYVKFNEELHTYLSWEEVKEPVLGSEFLIGLDEYGEKILTVKEIDKLIEICDGFLVKYNTANLNDQKIRYFADKLKQLCQEALLKYKLIAAIGD